MHVEHKRLFCRSMCQNMLNFPKRHTWKKNKIWTSSGKRKSEVLFLHQKRAQIRHWLQFHTSVCYLSHKSITHSWDFSLLFSVLKQKCQCGTEKLFQFDVKVTRCRVQKEGRPGMSAKTWMILLAFLLWDFSLRTHQCFAILLCCLCVHCIQDWVDVNSLREDRFYFDKKWDRHVF